MGFNTGMSEDDVEELRREYELELGGLEKELATLRDEVDELNRIIVGQCGVITELRIKLARDAIKSFAGEASK